MSDSLSIATTDAVVAKVTSSPIKSRPFSDVTNQDLPSGAITSQVEVLTKISTDVLPEDPAFEEDETEIYSSDEDDSALFDDHDYVGFDFEDKHFIKGSGKMPSSKNMSRQERRKEQRAAEKVAATREKNTAAKKAAKTKRRSQSKKTAICMREELILDGFDAALPTNFAADSVDVSSTTLAPRLPGANGIDEDVFNKCELISPDLPSLEAIPVALNPFDALQETCLEPLPGIVDAPAREGILMRVSRLIGGLAARVAALVKRGFKVVKHLIVSK